MCARKHECVQNNQKHLKLLLHASGIALEIFYMLYSFSTFVCYLSGAGQSTKISNMVTLCVNYLKRHDKVFSSS